MVEEGRVEELRDLIDGEEGRVEEERYLIYQ